MSIVKAQDNDIEIINPHYPVNGRMCTLEDLFIEYNQLNLLDNPYILLAPDKDLCPSVQDIFNDDIKVYYIEKAIYDNLMDESKTITLYEYIDEHKVTIMPNTYNFDTARPADIYGTNGNSSEDKSINQTENGGTTTTSETLYQCTYPGTYTQTKATYQNYWAIYMNETVFTNAIINRMVQFFNSTEITENDVENVLLNILATKFYNEMMEQTGKAVYIKDFTPYDNRWSQVADILIEFFNDVFMNMKYKNEYVFYSSRTATSGIKAFNIMKDYWTKITPDYNPDQKKCRFEFSVAQDINGFYIKTTSPIVVKKYLCRKIVDYDINGISNEFLQYIHMDDIIDMAKELLHWIQKNFIYLPYHIPNIGVNTEGSQRITFIAGKGSIGENKAGGDLIWTTRPYDYGKDGQNDWDIEKKKIYQNYKKYYEKSLIRMCDIRPGFFVFNDDSYDNDGSTNTNSHTANSNTAFLYNQTNTAKLMDYALTPDNYKTINAEYELKYYTYLCTVDIGNNNLNDALEVTPDAGVSYTIQQTYNEKDKPMYNIALMPNTINSTGYIKTYTSTLKQKMSNITKNLIFRQYPTQFLVIPQLKPLSSRYHYEIEAFTVNSANVNAECLNIVNNNALKGGDSIIYQYQQGKIDRVLSDGKVDIKLKDDTTVTSVDKSELKLDTDIFNNIYYKFQNLTPTAELDESVITFSMSITISVYLSSEYNAWRMNGYYFDAKGEKEYKLLPITEYEVDNDDACNIYIEFYEITNYTNDDTNLLADNRNSIHKYVAGRTDLAIDQQFSTQKFSTTIPSVKTITKSFSTNYTSWLDSKRVSLMINQFIPGISLTNDEL